jgi:hypothetical protein
VLSIWLQLWAAALIVLALFVLVMGALVWLGIRRLRLVENPVDSFKRHIDDHLDWWQNSLLSQGRALDVPATAVPVDAEGGELP